jgi:subtilisin-like proprotein convertase family protein
VQSVNSTFRVWNKTGTPLIATTPLHTLFAGLGTPCGTSDDGDPIVNYDQLADRWLISEFCIPSGDPNVGPFYQIFAVSKTGDPTGAYYLYRFLSPGTNVFPDYPHVGVWPDAYYMTTNQFTPADFVGTGAYAFNRNKMLVGDPTANFVYFNKGDGCPADCTFSGMQPSDLDGFALPPAGAPNAFAMFDANESGGAHSDSLIIYDFHVDFATPANSTFTQRTGSPLAVAAFDPTAATNIPQPGGTPLDPITDRLMFRLSYRNLGTKETLTVNHTVNASGNATFRAGGRVYQLSKATPAAAFVIDEQTTWAPADTENRWMGSAAQNYLGDIAYGFSVSSATVFPSVRYAAHLATDAPGSGLAQGEQTLIAGTSAQTSASGRWGDYSDLSIDPNDDCTFWYTQEYMGGGTTWKTRIGAFNVRATPCTISPRGSIQGTITNCQTSLPIANAQVTISGGYSRATNASGVYSATVTPATYTASVTGPNFDPASSGSLVVANGGSTTFTACLNGTLKQPVADTAIVTADSCNSNGIVDPNETVTVTFGIKNTGNLNTTNLVATLQATGGVTSPSGPQTYGVVIAGGPTVVMPFAFTSASLSCGSTITATFSLQDGATNLGTITYSIAVGQTLNILASSGNVAAAIPDALPTGVDVPITVANVATLSDVNVSIRLNHTFVGDLVVSLIHPDGTAVLLVNNRGGAGANYGSGTNDCAGTPTTFDDSAVNPISGIAASGAPFAATFKPEGSLAALNGKPTNGTWKLHVVDNASQDAGTVGCVKLELNKQFVCCGPLVNAAPPPLITAESVNPANNAPDPEETVTVNLPLVNVGGSPTANLVATLLPTGGVAGPSGPQNYGALAGPGGTATRPFTFTAQGTCGSNITLTLALQDGALSLGTATFTMQLGTASVSAPQTFSNPAAITIPSSGSGVVASSPYPSAIAVAGLTGTTAKVTVTLTGITHAFASDMDLLLVSPTGQKFIIVSDTIRSGTVTNATYTLDDAASTLLPNSGPPASGTYRPSNVGAGDTFPASAPAAPYLSPATAGVETFASAFNGANPNGTWNLYVVDDFGSADAGSISGGWSITITTTNPVCNTQSCNITPPGNQTLPATCGSAYTYTPAVTFTGACGVVVVNPPSGSLFGIGTTNVLVRGTRADNSFTDASFTVTVPDNETQATGAGPTTNTFCNSTVAFAAVTTPGNTTVTDAPSQTLPAPYQHCSSCPELNITTTAVFTNPPLANDAVTTCITMPASTDFNTFSRLRMLHGEPVNLVNRTSSSNFTTKKICAKTDTVSPFVVALDPNAPTAAPATISGRITTADGAALPGVTLNLGGARSARAITDSQGNYRFSGIDTDNFYTVTPSLVNYHFGPESQSFSLLANKTDATFTAARNSVSIGNAIDTADFFVRQHYVDFLGREPDESGFNFWSNQISSCGSDAACIERRTINVSAAYFLSIEFQQTGGLVDGLYRASYARAPHYAEFMPDTATVSQGVVVGPDGNWAQTLEANKQAFVEAWMQRADFRAAYHGLSNSAFVDTLISHTVGFNGDRDALINGLNSNSMTRATALRQVVENEGFVAAKSNRMFVMMEYFGYLRRDPDESGYQFWLNKLDQFDGNFEQAEMVKAFIVSGEYRNRFRQ